MGIKDVLAAPWVYDIAQYVIRGAAYAPEFVSRYIKAKPGDRVLDIGCGTGVMLHYLPEVEYVGFDMSKTYIDACKKRFGNRGTFHQCEVKPDTIADYGQFDIVLAVGVVHHLDDAKASNMFTIASKALSSGGRLITLDGCYTTPQSALVRRLLDNDRGEFIRTEPAYRTIAESVFTKVTTSIRHDMFRIPYTVIVMECVS
jgi:cyclopropane fatty-acyl-phospholipid synthase-like methyltransferase